ncbi:MAG: exodeoxyribonuclease V subunit alpha [Candidatus Thiodiazotropha sp.]
MTPQLRLLQILRGHQAIAELDLQFARLLLAEATEPGDALALAAALASRASAEGHVCLDLRRAAGQPLVPAAPQVAVTPSLASWRSALRASGVVGHPGEWQPLILDAADRLYLHRYWRYEQRLGQALLERADGLIEGIDTASLKPALDSLFKRPPGVDIDWQKVAAATALLRRLSVISGGPGTGKTSTVVRILALLRSQPGGGDLRIALAAPTGMAASRLQQSIRESKRTLPLPGEAVAAIPENATTLHRLLGVRRQGTGFRHHRDDPLPLDVLVLDEASMVDVALMAKLLDALPSAARLILLGDRDQLASVEAGAVLGDICKGCDGPGSAFAEILRQGTGEPIPETSAEALPLSDNVVTLRHSYRFAGESPIGRLAAAVNRGDAAGAEVLLQGDGDNGIAWLEAGVSLTALAAERYAALFHDIAAGAPVAQLFERLRGFRVLCALRGGPDGAERINAAITRQLQRMGLASSDSEWYPGRPVMITRNDYPLELYNGDTGIVLPHPEGGERLSVAFAGTDGEPRWISPARLSECETVYALTVHKSQGSEFDQVVLKLPDQMSPVLCRELIYTAITRSRGRFALTGPTAVFRDAVGHRLARQGGLSDLLARRQPGAMDAD